MFDELNEKIQLAKEGITRIMKLQNAIILLEREKEPVESKVNYLYKNVMEQNRNVAKLTKISLRKVFYSFINQLAEQTKRAKRKAIASQEEYDSAKEKLDYIQYNIDKHKEELKNLSGCQEQFEHLCNQKKEYLLHTGKASETLIQLVNKHTLFTNIETDINKAVELGRTTYNYFKDVEVAFDKAINCAMMQKGAGLNTLIFYQAKEDSFIDAKNIIGCFRKHIDNYNKALQADSLSSYVTFGPLSFNYDALIELIVLDKTVRGNKQGKEIILSTKADLDEIMRKLYYSNSIVTQTLNEYQKQISRLLADF